jgi:heme/copper-type cytochrome/quinol oxidase subunit 4
MSAESASDMTGAPPEPLFVLELGANGGTVAPTTAQQFAQWLQNEARAWQWMQPHSAGPHKELLNRGFSRLQQAIAVAEDAQRSEANGDLEGTKQRLINAQSIAADTFVRLGWPHTTSSLWHEVDQWMQQSPLTAIAYLAIRLPNPDRVQVPINAADVETFRGFIAGIRTRDGGIDESAVQLEGKRRALDDLQGQYAQALGNATRASEATHRAFEATAKAIAGEREQHRSELEILMKQHRAEHAGLVAQHEDAMDALRETFKAAMALRAPVEYWKSRATHHRERAEIGVRWMFATMFLLACLLGLLANWLFNTGTQPDPWKAGIVALIGVIGVWAVRLLVRMYLSHEHLANDGDERVTMVMTYLALIEGGKMPSDEDRKLVLAPLFRPASDGMVKDEGMPHPVLEALTRGGKT